jgi:hypothetical protein
MADAIGEVVQDVGSLHHFPSHFAWSILATASWATLRSLACLTRFALTVCLAVATVACSCCTWRGPSTSGCEERVSSELVVGCTWRGTSTGGCEERVSRELVVGHAIGA